jgi:3-hydroxyacyl-[acyl-carrier-protein] dehydratase
MLLKDKFYTISSLNEENGTIQAAISIDPKHEIFEGHFPGNPVTPGVVQMEIIKELLSTHFNRPLHLKNMSNCKFLAILNPNDTPDIVVKLTLLPNEADTVKISGVISSEANTFLKIQAEYC